ncbi:MULTISPECIES: hypothetical protein [Pseudomonas]|uniref:Uncharacterized protein n=1 Tax=Pseudomonas capeferrum TaxID=1495066 RepID=A0ABY7RDB9_9PSED|nr:MULTISPECIES: hypothetical protein [Pseudomonas]KGI94733.1 hypothetical protein MD26_04425 [Pseudomonas sp. H2]MUT51904.1 hypothetical protein [Pseudomonas sp. TDA1]WCI01586.1 hypothetical protein PMC74_06705 [Pseudomonas capeferrum]
MSEMNAVNFNAGRWMYSVANKITRIIPGLTLTIILLTLAAQISLLAASFLPLKAIILIGSPNIPSYFPEYLKAFERKDLFLLLCSTAALFYVLYLLSEALIKKLTKLGSERLILNSRKMILFDGQNEVASKAYLRFTRSLAAIVFLSLTIAALGYIYLELTIATLAFWLCWAIAIKLNTVIKKSRKSQNIQTNYESINPLGSVGFFAAFSYLAYDLLSDTPPKLLPAIIGILLTRQIMQRATLLIQDLTSLKEQHLQISALFFKDHKLPSEARGKPEKFWSLFTNDSVNQWASDLLQELSDTQYVKHDIKWHQTGIHDVFAIEVESETSSGQKEIYLIKVFNTNRTTLAINEATLLMEPNLEGIPTARLLQATVLDGFHCHIFTAQSLNKIPAIETGIHQAASAKILMRHSPPQSLIQKYSRSRPLLWDRLNDTTLNGFGTALNGSEHLHEFRKFMQLKHQLREILRSTPLFINNSQIGKDQIFVSNDGKLSISYWGNWSLEPIGASLQLKNLSASLPSLMADLQQHREDTQQMSEKHLMLAALCFSLDQLLSRQHYLSAAELLPEITALVTSIETENLAVIK